MGLYELATPIVAHKSSDDADDEKIRAVLRPFGLTLISGNAYEKCKRCQYQCE